MDAADRDSLRFGEFELSRAPLALRRRGTTVRLRMQALQLLVLLAERPGEIVTHEQIRAALWNGRWVEFRGSVHVCIRQVRAALHDDAAQPRFIETVPRQGYRFLPRVERQAPSVLPRVAQRRAAAAVGLPLVLALATLAVTGSVTGWLMHRGDGAVARDTREDPARDAYLRGKFLLDGGGRDAARKSVGYFHEALASDSAHAPSHVALAKAHRLLGNGADSAEYAQRALLLAPRSAEAHVQMAITLMEASWDWDGAGKHLARALELDPSLAEVHHVAAARHAALGDLGAAVAEINRALELEPVSTLLRADAGWFLYYQGDFDGAIGRCREALDLDADHVASLLCVQRAAEAKGDDAAATAAALRIMQLWGASADEREAVAALPARQAPRAYHEWRLQLFARYPDRTAITPGDFADVRAALGDYDEALAQLERAVDAKESVVPFLLADRIFEPLHADPRFGLLRARLGLPPPAG